MNGARLTIDTSLGAIAGPSSTRSVRERIVTPGSASSKFLYPSSDGRNRRSSAASSNSSLSIVSPKSSSTNASTSSLPLDNEGSTYYALPSPTSPLLDETVRLASEYVLAMHDFTPQNQNATCLAFRAGQVIHVLNRDTSGWWDGELEGRRGWFPSNYVNADVDVMDSLQDEELPRAPRRRPGHTQSSSTASATSWPGSGTAPDFGFTRADSRSSRTESVGSDTESYCPPLMIPLLHGLSILQNAVRGNRVTHFQPSTACIISCVRSILSATGCLPREAPLLKRFPILSQERKRILSVLASLVAQAKKASDDSELDDEKQDAEVEAMLRLGGQVFAHVRRFLVVAVQCGVEVPQQKQLAGSDYESTDTEGLYGSNQSTSSPYGRDSPNHIRSAVVLGHWPALPMRHREERLDSATRARSMTDLRSQLKTDSVYSDSMMPLLPDRAVMVKSKQEQYQRMLTHRPAMLSVSSTSSSSSFESFESIGTPATPAFPSGPSTTAQVMEALRHTHDNYLSTIAAFIGHAHSHSRTSHASSTGHMYDLVREVVEMVCKLLTIVEAVMHHPDVPTHKLGNLKSAKEGLYNVTSTLAESVRLLTISLPTTTTEEEEKASLLRSATGALKAGADCVAAVKMCLNRSTGERSFVIQLPAVGEPGPEPLTPSRFVKTQLWTSGNTSALRQLEGFGAGDEEDITIQAQTSPIPIAGRMSFDGSDDSSGSKSSSGTSGETNGTSPDDHIPIPPSPKLTPDDDGTIWEGSQRAHHLEQKTHDGSLPSVPQDPLPSWEEPKPATHYLSHDYSPDDVAFNNEGHLVGATVGVLVEKMTPHDSIVDPAFASVFFLTFRLFSSPPELVEVVITRYNLHPPPNISAEDRQLWEQRKGIPVRLRVANFVKLWLEMYWRPSVDNVVLRPLMNFVRETIAATFTGPAQRILELIHMRVNMAESSISPRGDRMRDPGMSINPPSAPPSEIPRPSMTKTLLAALRSKSFSSISITDFDALELARQLTIMECDLYCAIQPEEILETGQEGAKPPVNVRAVSTLSTVITGWVAESILNEPDIKKRQALIKFFIKVADRATSLHNYSSPRSVLAALDSSTISRLHQTWLGLPQKNRQQLEALRRLADHGRNYYEYRTKLRNTAPPAVPFLGLYLTDVTFCREGNPSHRASPRSPDKKLLNFNKYHKLARIVQDMQRFQKPYNLKAIPEVQAYLNVAFENSKHHGDLQDLYRRSLLVEPRQPADTPPTSDMRHLFSWATRSQPAA